MKSSRVSRLGKSKEHLAVMQQGTYGATDPSTPQINCNTASLPVFRYQKRTEVNARVTITLILYGSPYLLLLFPVYPKGLNPIEDQRRSYIRDDITPRWKESCNDNLLITKIRDGCM